MTQYRIDRAEVTPALCSRGKQHVEEAVISTSTGGEQKTPEELLEMQRGNTFVRYDASVKAEDWPKVIFDKCACGQGVVMSVYRS